jgi:hypothetical protein
MQALWLLIQVLLVAGWYTVPAMATLPTWVIFLPVIMSLTGLLIALVFLVGIAGLSAWSSTPPRRRFR